MGVLGDVVAWLTDPANYEGTFGIPNRLYEHFLMSFQSTALAALVALPLGLFIGHTRKLEFVAVTVGNLGRALPSFGILGLTFSFFATLPGAIGFWPTFTALFLLALPPILTNTYIGVKAVDQDTVEAARGMGMSERGLLGGLEIPLAAPLIIAGLRVAAVQVVATATLGAVGGWGGLGRYIVDGFAVSDSAQIVGGAVLVALFAFATELVFGALERVATPRVERSRRGLLGRTNPRSDPGPASATT